MPVREEDDEKSAIDSPKITVTVKNQDGNEVFFKINRRTQLQKLIHGYCERESMNMDSVAFLFDDCFLRREHTPSELGMEDGDEIYAFYAKSLKRYKKNSPSQDLEKGSCGQSPVEMEEHKEIIDAHTFDELEKRTTHSFAQTMSFLKASFHKSNRLTESLKADLNAKMVAEKVAEKDLIIEQMQNELRQANAAISNLSREQSRLAEEFFKVKKEFVKPEEETVKIVRNEVGETSRRVAGSQNELKRARLHGPTSIKQSSMVQESRISVEEKDKKLADDLARIHIQVKGLNGESVFLKIQRSTKLGKVMQAYCDREGKDIDSMRFLFDDRIIRREQTPYELQMGDGDDIFAMPSMSG